MSLYRRNPKRDANELAIVQVLEQRGFHVDRVSAPGFPDLIVSKYVRGLGGQAWFVEVKQPKGRFTLLQNLWRTRWQGPAPLTLRSIDDALAFPNLPKGESSL